MYENNTNKPQRRLIKDLPPSHWPSNRLIHAGARALTAVELLAIVIGRDDGIDLAQEIITGFGGIRGLATASIDELQQYYGIGEQTAVRIQAALALGLRAVSTPDIDRPRITSPMDASTILMPLISNLAQENLIVIVLDTRNRVLLTHTLYIGSLNSSVIRISDIFKVALSRNGAAIILGHNHPSGDPSPSPEDINELRRHRT